MTEKNPHVLHAEQMALSGSDRDIYSGATIEVTYAPCEKCAVLIHQCGIAQVNYIECDKSKIGINYLIEKGLRVCKI